MKKLFLLTAVMVASVAYCVRAEVVHTPQGEAQSLATADYGGVDYSTAPIFNTLLTTVATRGGCRLYGVMFSSGLAGSYDYVTVYDATSAVTSVAGTEVVRLYNISNTTSTTSNNNQSASGFSGPPKPIRFRTGLTWKPSSAAYSNIILLFYKDPDR